MPISFVIALPLGLAIFWLAKNSRAATETPDYRVVRTDAKFEIRDYPAMMVATTPMENGEMNVKRLATATTRHLVASLFMNLRCESSPHCVAGRGPSMGESGEFHLSTGSSPFYVSSKS